MPFKYLALEEETSSYGTHVSNATPIYIKLLSENIETTREDYFPEVTDHPVQPDKAEGHFRGGGEFSTLVDPLVWPKLLVMFLGDSVATQVSSNAYSHVFRFGDSNPPHVTSGAVTSGPKSFTISKGVGIEKDRMFYGGFIESMTLEALAREPVQCTVGVITNGKELLRGNLTPTYTSYSTGLYLSFADTTTMTISGETRLTTQPVVEAFRVTLTRGYDTDAYRLGSRYLPAMTPSGLSSVEGTIDYAFKDQGEHERFLNIVGGTGTGDQANFPIVFKLQGDAIGTTNANYGIQLDIPKTYYTASETSMTARDRIVQTVDYKGLHDTDSSCACYFTVTTTNSSYAPLV